MDLSKGVGSAAVHLLKGKRGDILRLPGVMYLDCSTNLALQVRDLYNHVRTEIYQYRKIWGKSRGFRIWATGSKNTASCELYFFLELCFVEVFFENPEKNNSPEHGYCSRYLTWIC